MSLKPVHFSHALLVFLGLFSLIAAGMFFLNQLLHVALFAGLIWVAVHARILGFKYITMREMMNVAIARALPAIYIFLLIGLLIAALMKSGTVATLIYYGLDWLSPTLFLPIGFILCALMSMVTGTSWGTVGTLGVVFMGMAEGLGLPLYWIAGMVISGATFGDKMSPISDTTNLAAMSTETDLYDHIKSMLMTTGPAFILVLVIFALVGWRLPVHEDSLQQVEIIRSALAGEFNLNPWITLWPLLVMVVLSYRRFEAEISMTSAVVVAVIIAALFQHQNLPDIAQALWANTVTVTGIEYLDKLLGRGGLYNMAWTLLLAIIAIALGGILHGAGFIDALFGGFVKRIHRTGSLVAATIGTGLVMVAALGEAYIAIILNSQLYKEVYKNKGLNSSLLSRSVEEGVTLMTGLIPWTTAGAFYAATLGLSVVDYAPYALLNWLNPLLAILLAYLGFAVFKHKKS